MFVRPSVGEGGRHAPRITEGARGEGPEAAGAPTRPAPRGGPPARYSPRRLARWEQVEPPVVTAHDVSGRVLEVTLRDELEAELATDRVRGRMVHRRERMQEST